MTLLNSISEDFLIWEFLDYFFTFKSTWWVLVWILVYSQNLHNTYGLIWSENKMEVEMHLLNPLREKGNWKYVLWINRKVQFVFFMNFNPFPCVPICEWTIEWSKIYHRRPSFSTLIFPLTWLHRYDLVACWILNNLFFPR